MPDGPTTLQLSSVFFFFHQSNTRLTRIELERCKEEDKIFESMAVTFPFFFFFCTTITKMKTLSTSDGETERAVNIWYAYYVMASGRLECSSAYVNLQIGSRLRIYSEIGISYETIPAAKYRAMTVSAACASLMIEVVVRTDVSEYRFWRTRIYICRRQRGEVRLFRGLRKLNKFRHGATWMASGPAVADIVDNRRVAKVNSITTFAPFATLVYCASIVPKVFTNPRSYAALPYELNNVKYGCGTVSCVSISTFEKILPWIDISPQIYRHFSQRSYHPRPQFYSHNSYSLYGKSVKSVARAEGERSTRDESCQLPHRPLSNTTFSIIW